MDDYVRKNISNFQLKNNSVQSSLKKQHRYGRTMNDQAIRVYLSVNFWKKVTSQIILMVHMMKLVQT